jgi:hypothetical protein
MLSFGPGSREVVSGLRDCGTRWVAKVGNGNEVMGRLKEGADGMFPYRLDHWWDLARGHFRLCHRIVMFTLNISN